MARAINSLPTPDSPSISTGMFDFAARSASRIVRAMFSTLVTMSRNVSSPARRRVARRSSSSSASTRSAFLIETCKPLGADRLDDEIQRAGAHRRDHRLDRAMRGLHDRGNVDVALAHPVEHAHAVEIGHHEIEDDQIDRRAVASPPAAPGPLRPIRRSRLRSRSAGPSPRAGGAESGSSSTIRIRAAMRIPVMAALRSAACRRNSRPSR